jgi:hypothetical protein
MFWAIGAVLLHLQAAPQAAVISAPAEKLLLVEASSSDQVTAFEPGRLALTPVADSSAALPAFPAATPMAQPIAPAIALRQAPAFAGRATNGQQRKWLALAVAQHSAAVLDAWTTRRAITQTGAHELNPMLKPFAGNSSMYAATQIAPVLLDMLGHRMMTSHRSLLRRTWWLPQTLGAVASFSGAANNLLVH